MRARSNRKSQSRSRMLDTSGILKPYLFVTTNFRKSDSQNSPGWHSMLTSHLVLSVWRSTSFFLIPVLPNYTQLAPGNFFQTLCPDSTLNTITLGVYCIYENCPERAARPRFSQLKVVLVRGGQCWLALVRETRCSIRGAFREKCLSEQHRLSWAQLPLHTLLWSFLLPRLKTYPHCVKSWAEFVTSAA